MAKTPQEVAQKWQQRLASSQEAIRRGVERVTESPTAAAARAAGLWQQRVSSQEARDKFVRGAQRVTAESWKRDMIEKGVGRVASGATAAQPKMERFMAEFLPFQESVTNTVRQMPKSNLEERINRMVAQVRGTSAFRRSS